MPTAPTLKQALRAIGAALIFACGAAAYAHTTVKSQMTEGTTDDNALKIGHGCTATGLSVTAQSAIFPQDPPMISTSDGSVITDLSTVISQGSLVGLVKPIQDRSIFRTQVAKTDTLGNVTGFHATSGLLTFGIPGRVPFQFTAPNFVPTSCANRLLIKIAIADVCVRGVNLADSIKEGKANLWIPDNGSNLANAGKAANVDGIGAPATLTINRNLATNPLPSGCGSGIDVTVTPNPSDVDNNLPIPGYWP